MIDRYSKAEDYLVNTLEICEEQYCDNKDRSVNQSFQSVISMDFAKAMRISHFKYHNGTFLIFNGVVYRKSPCEGVEALVGDVMERKNYPPLYSVRSRREIVRHCSSALYRGSFKPDKHLIAFNNVVYDIRAGVTMAHSADLNVINYLDFEFNPANTCPKWMQFLREVVESDEKILMLQEYLGAAFIDRSRHKLEKMLFLVGSGQNGKGVFTNTIRELFGCPKDSSEEEKRDGLVTAFSPQEIFREGNKQYMASAINGKLLNICDDMSNQDFSGGDFKKAVAGEPMSARDPYGKPFTVTDMPLFIASTNEFPKVAQDRTDGNYRRYWVVEFNVKISESQRDPNLKEKLLMERSGILNWIFAGYKRMIKNGCKFTHSLENEKAVEKLRIAQDSRLQWLQDREYSHTQSEGSERERKNVTELYEDYVKYCKENNYNAFGRQEFSRRLTQEGFDKQKSSNNRYFFIWIGGAKFKDDEAEVVVEEKKKIDDIFVPKAMEGFVNLPF